MLRWLIVGARMSDASFAATYPKSRKKHYCQQCGRVIEVGEKYRRQGGIYDGSMYSGVCCLQCEAFAGVLHSLGFEDDGGAWPWIVELDRADVSELGLGYEYDLFKRKWRESNGLLVVPLTAESNWRVGNHA